MKLISSIKFVKKNKININEYREDFINFYYKHFILLNGYDKIDAFLKVTNTSINDYLDKDIYKDATNYKKAIDFVNRLSNKNTYFLLLKKNKLIGIIRFKENKRKFKVLELISDKSLYIKILKYIEKYCKSNNIKKISIEIPVNNIPLLIRTYKYEYIEEDINLLKSKKYIVNKDLK